MKLNFIWKSLFFMYVMIWLNLREREEYVNYNNKGVKSDKTISNPDNTIGKASKGEEKGHILHTFCGKNQFLHPKKEITLS